MNYNALLDHHDPDNYDPEAWIEGNGMDYNDYLYEEALRAEEA